MTRSTDPRSNRLRATREFSGVSQATLARRMGIDESLVSRAERGLIETWPKFRRDAAAALGVPEAQLFADRVEARSDAAPPTGEC